MKIIEITVKFEDHKQTLKGEQADKWFTAIADSMRTFPPEVVAAPWKKRKLKAKKEAAQSESAPLPSGQGVEEEK